MSLCQDGSTPLILAAQMSRVELCAFLLGRGANANIQDHEGRWSGAFFSLPLKCCRVRSLPVPLWQMEQYRESDSVEAEDRCNSEATRHPSLAPKGKKGLFRIIVTYSHSSGAARVQMQKVASVGYIWKDEGQNL